MANTLTPIVPVLASGPGALDGFETVCTCGMRLTSSLESALRLDAQRHLAWHEQVGR